jgi:hypothetical protein
MKVKRVCEVCGTEVVMQHYPLIAKIGEQVFGRCDICNAPRSHQLQSLGRV